MMLLTAENNLKISKFMSFILRHKPKDFDINLDTEGYCTLDSLIVAIHSNRKLVWVRTEHILEVVRSCEKQRYEVTGDKIRARYGHSAKKVEYTVSTPPSLLYHGTNEKVVGTILSEGVKPMSRQYVHLSETTKFATLAGKRRGELVLVKVDTAKAVAQGVKFFFAGDEVWLSTAIPAECLSV